MKRTLVIVVLMAPVFCFAKSVYVKPHIRSDGTYVQGHHRSSPDRTVNNNYSTQGNYNLYTGKPGTVSTEKAEERKANRQRSQSSCTGPYSSCND